MIELLVVASIISLLAAIILEFLGPARYKARDAKRIEEARQVVVALDLYKSDNGQYPASVGGGTCPPGTPGGAECSFGHPNFLQALSPYFSGGTIPDGNPLNESIQFIYFRGDIGAGYGNCSGAVKVYIIIPDFESNPSATNLGPGGCSAGTVGAWYAAFTD